MRGSCRVVFSAAAAVLLYRLLHGAPSVAHDVVVVAPALRRCRPYATFVILRATTKYRRGLRGWYIYLHAVVQP